MERWHLARQRQRELQYRRRLLAVAAAAEEWLLPVEEGLDRLEEAKEAVG